MRLEGKMKVQTQEWAKDRDYYEEKIEKDRRKFKDSAKRVED
jgi:hypothetical protein